MPEYQQGQSYLEYIRSSVNEINNYHQNLFDWRYDRQGHQLPIVTEALHNFPEFAEIVNRIPDALSREDIQNAFIRDNYEGLIATVLWGG